MEKRESPKTKDNLKPKISGLSNKTFSIIKFVLGICLLPFVYSVSTSFLKEFGLIERAFQGYFWAGIISFVVIYLLIYEPAIIYRKGHRLLEIIFSFFAPLVKVAPYLLPIYAIVIFIVYLLLSFIFKSREFFSCFLFLFGFSLALHLVFSAKSVRSKQNDFLKANYIFGFSFIYIINIVLLAFCVNLIFKEFSFVNFFNSSFQEAKNITMYIVRSSM